MPRIETSFGAVVSPAVKRSFQGTLRRVYRLRYADRTLGGDARFSFSFCFRLDFVSGPVVTVFPRGRCAARTPATSSRFQIAVYDLLLIDVVQITRLTEGKQMLGPPVAFQ